MNAFANWSIADVERHNARVCKENRIPTKTSGEFVQESELHEAIFSECRRRGWIPLHGSMAERTHRTLGEPDFEILADRGRTIRVECKSKKGKLSTHQQAFIAHASRLGHDVHIVRSIEEFLNICDNYLL